MPPTSRRQQKAACADKRRMERGAKGRTFKSRKVAAEFCAPVKRACGGMVPKMKRGGVVRVEGCRRKRKSF